jgi:hypothetical protein
MFSSSGLRLGTNDARFKAHKAWLSHRKLRREALIFFENVPGFPIAQLERNLGGTCDVLSSVVDPRQLGYASARPRLWCMCIDRQKARWNCDRSFCEVLALLGARPRMSAKDFARVAHPVANHDSSQLTDISLR